MSDPAIDASNAVGAAMLAAFRTDEYRATHDPMIAWRMVAQLVRSAPDDETAARLVQAVSECIKTDLRPGTWAA